MPSNFPAHFARQYARRRKGWNFTPGGGGAWEKRLGARSTVEMGGFGGKTFGGASAPVWGISWPVGNSRFSENALKCFDPSRAK